MHGDIFSLCCVVSPSFSCEFSFLLRQLLFISVGHDEDDDIHALLGLEAVYGYVRVNGHQ